ncbi:pLS20_p028 family conjugation system transmembrane protein [Bacillus anthracis]|uniref:pLS20_p028 family conjugation system transmembrane protein n=1 Tax=Bacillus anthracis TaxID=1392 RepID=UPI002FBEF424
MATMKIKEWFFQSKKALVIGILAVITLFVSFTFTPIAYAFDWYEFLGLKDVDTEKVVAFLQNEWIQYADFLGSIWQSIQGGIIKTLLYIVSALEGLIPDTFSFFDILKDAGLNDFASSIIKGLFYALFVLVIVWLGIRTIIQHKPPRFKSVGVNILVMIGLLGGLNELMADMQKMSTDFFSETTNTSKAKDGLAWDLVKQNTADLIYLSKTGFEPIQSKKENEPAISSTDSKPKNGMSKDIFLKAQLGDVVTPKVIEMLTSQKDIPKETEYLVYKITNDGDKETVEKINDSVFNPFKDKFPGGYVRYPMNFGTIFWGLLALGVAYLFTVFVFVMTIFEIAMKKIIAPIVFVTDIETGEKTKMVIQDIFKGFLVFAFTGLNLRVYTIIVNYLAEKDINAFLYIVAMVCLTVALINGSESILKYFGVDVGLKEGKNHLTGMVGGAMAAKGAIKGAGRMFSGAKNLMSGGSGQTREDTPKRSEMDSNHESAESQGEQKNTAKGGGMQAKKFARNTGAAMSYAANRGVGGMMNDAGNKVAETVGGAVDKGKEKVSGVAKGVSDSVKGTVSEFKGGQAEGKQKAQENADRQTLNTIGKGIQNNANAGIEPSASPKIANRPNVASISNERQQGNIKGERQTAEREIELQNKLRNTGKEEGKQGNVKSERQTAEREIELQNKLRNTGSTEGQQGNVKGERQTAEREIEIQNKLRNTGGTEASQGNMKSGSQTVQREVNVLDTLRSTGGTGTINSDAKAGVATIQRDVNVQNNIRGSEAVDSNVRAGSTTVQRDVNVQNNVRGSEAVESNVRAGSTTVQRDVNVQNNVRGSEAVESAVRAGSTTVQRDVNVQNNVRGSEAVESSVRAGSTTVQRDVNVQNNVRGSSEVTADVRVGTTTVQRDVNVQDNVKEVRKSRLRPRGSTQNRTDQLRRR